MNVSLEDCEIFKEWKANKELAELEAEIAQDEAELAAGQQAEQPERSTPYVEEMPDDE